MAFDRARYEQEVIRPLRGRHGRLPEGDLLARYAVEESMTAPELEAHLRKVRAYWNQRAGGPDNRAQVCRQLLAADEELRRRVGPAMHDPAWWREQAGERDRTARETVERLAADLAKAYGGLGKVTRAQLAAVVAHGPVLSQRQIDAAVGRARVQVVEAVELPAGSGLDRVAYRNLVDRLAEAGVPTVVQLLHPDLDRPFHLIGGFRVPGRPALRLDRGVVEERIRAAESTADSSAVRARKAALGILRTGLNNNADPATVALYQVVDQLRAGRSRGIADVLLVRTATDLGLAIGDAELLAVSLPAVAEAPVSAADHIRDLIGQGLLRSAEQALAALPTRDPEHAALRAQVDEAQAGVDRLLDAAARAEAGRHEEEAERLLRRAAALAGDDETITHRLERLPPPPPRELAAIEDGAGVRLSWQPSGSAAPRLRYRVVRADGPAPGSPHAGTRIGETTGLDATDEAPPVARQLGYAVFASADGTLWSRPATASVAVLPPLTDVTLRAYPDHVAGSWRAHPATVAVRVCRTVRRPPAAIDQGTGVRASTASFVDREITEGEAYYYGLAAVYHDSRGREATGPMVVASASPRAAAQPVELDVTPVSVVDGVVRVLLSWPTVTGTEVRVRRADRPPPWDFAAVVTPASVGGYGAEVVGRTRPDGPRTVLEAEVPLGFHVYVPFAVGGTGAVVGRPVARGLAEPVHGLRARRTGEHAILSWVWPDGVGIAEVAWDTPERGVATRRLSRAQYGDENGCRLPVGAGGGTARVRGVTIGPEGEAMSPPVEATVDGRPVRLAYTVGRPPGLRARLSRQRVVAVRADADCAGVDLLVVAAAGAVMPLRAEQGTLLGRFADLDFAAGTARDFEVEVPGGLRRPYWIRCFVAAGRVTLVDPPIDQLKVA